MGGNHSRRTTMINVAVKHGPVVHGLKRGAKGQYPKKET